jgi:hypothetical protein
MNNKTNKTNKTNEDTDNLKKILNLIHNYEKNITIIQKSNNNILNRYKNMLNELIFEYYKTCEKNI